MKKIESQTSAAMVMKSFFQDDWKGFAFEEKATLIQTKEIKEGPAWMLKAERGTEKVLLIWETVSKQAYPCPYPAVFAYRKVEPSERTFTSKSLIGKVINKDGEIAIVWE